MAVDQIDDYTFTIAGKEVRVKKSIPLKDGDRLPAMMQACQDGHIRTIVKVLAVVLESWDFDGNPNDVRSYEDMDIFTVVLPMGKHVALHLAKRLEGQEDELKN